MAAAGGGSHSKEILVDELGDVVMKFGGPSTGIHVCV